MQTIKDRLSKYGKVIECEERNNSLYIKITDGFDGASINVTNCVTDIMNLSSLYTRVKSCLITKSLFECTLVGE